MFTRLLMTLGLLFAALTTSMGRVSPETTLVIQQPTNGTALTAAWSPDSQMLVIGGSRGLWLYTPQLKEIDHLQQNSGEITALAWHPEGNLIAATTRSRAVQIWDIATKKVQTLAKPQAVVQMYDYGLKYLIGSLNFSPDGTKLASTTPNLSNLWESSKKDKLRPGSVEIWDVASGKLVTTFKTDGPVVDVLWNPDGKRLLVNGLKMPEINFDNNEINWPVGFVKVLDAESGSLLDKWDSSKKNSVCIDADSNDQLAIARFAQWIDQGQTVVALTTGGNGHICSWNIDAAGTTGIFEGDIGGSIQQGFAVSLDGKSLAIARCHVSCGFEISTYTLVANVYVDTKFLTWSSDAHYLAAIGEGKVIVIDGTAETALDYSVTPVGTIDKFEQ